MNKVQALFAHKQKNILNIYFTAGYPTLHDTVPILEALQASGADLAEIGMPYSDPLADGPTIQASGTKALQNGMTLDLLFDQINQARQKVTMPLILMGYFNQVLQYGEEKFILRAKEAGIDCLILPDLPVEEFESKYRSLFAAADMDIAFLISPRTPEARIRHIDQVSNGFIYMVSSNSITGAKSTIQAEQELYFNRIHGMQLKNPRLIGFGISNQQTFKAACAVASGAIIGSAFIQALAEPGELQHKVHHFVQSILSE
jgi:tryptophan synthase alpha chain